MASSILYLAGDSQLSLVFTLQAIFSLVAPAVYTASVDRTSNQKLPVAGCGIALLAMGVSLLRLGINPLLAYTLLFALVRVVRTSFLIHGWNYARDFLGTRAANRVTPVIASASYTAVIVAGFTIPLPDGFLPPAEITLLWVATLWMIAITSRVMSRGIKAGAESEPIWGNTTQPRKERGSYLRNIHEGGFNLSHLPMIYTGLLDQIFYLADPWPEVLNTAPAAARRMGEYTFGL